MDGAGVILYQSPSVTRVLGYGRDALLSRPFIELVHDNDRDANKMERLERKILERLAIPDPYAT